MHAGKTIKVMIFRKYRKATFFCFLLLKGFWEKGTEGILI